MKKVQEGQGPKKRINSSTTRPNMTKQAAKENKTNQAKAHQKQIKTASVEVYLNVPTYMSPTRLTDSQSTSVLADIGNNLKSPPFLATQEETLEQQSDDDFVIQCTDLAYTHYVKSTLSKCLFALLKNREESIQISKEKSLTQRDKQNSQLIQIGKVLNSTGQLIYGVNDEPLHLSSGSEKYHSVVSYENELIAHKYNSVSLTMRAFISWKRYLYVRKRRRSMQIIAEQSRETSSKNITLGDVNTACKEEINPNIENKRPISSYQVKTEPVNVQKPVQSLSRQLFKKQSRLLNEDLQLIDEQAPPSKESQNVSVDQFRTSQISLLQKSQFTDDSYLHILSLPFSYKDRLKLKAFTGLRGYFELQMTRGIVFRKVSLLQKVFSVFSSTFKEHRLQKLFSKIQESMKKGLLRKVFVALRNNVHLEQRIRQFQEQSARKSAKSVLSVFSENSSFNAMVYKKLDLWRAKRCFSKLQMFCLESRIQRVGNVQTFEKMRLFWKRRILKVLFNMVRVAQRVEKLRVISGRMQDSQILRHCLKTWQIQAQLYEFKHKNYNRFIKKYFEPWLRESLRRVHAKKSFLIKRARNINARTMACFKQYFLGCKDKKQRLLSLFHIRANNLQKLAFKEGLVEFMRQVRLKRNLNLVAGIFLAQRMYKSTLNQLKAWVKLNSLGKTTSHKHNYLQGVKILKEWNVVAEHTKKLRKCRHKQDTKLKFFFVQRLKQALAIRKFKHAKLNFVINRYEKILLRKSITCLEKAVAQMQDNLEGCEVLLKNKAVSTRKLVFGALAHHRQRQLYKKEKVAQITAKTAIRVKYLTFAALIENKVLKNKVKQSIPVLAGRQHRQLENLFTFMRLYSIRKMNQRLCIESLREIRNARIGSMVINLLFQYAKLHQRSTYFNKQAQLKRRFQLIKKTMQSMFQWKLNKAREAEVTLLVCSQRRQNIFSRWHKYVHDLLPKLKQVKIHYLRQRFTTFKLYVQQRFNTRIQRRKIKSASKNSVTLHQINQAIYWLYLNSQERIHQRSKIELTDRIWKSRQFQKWVSVLPELKRINRNKIKAERFNRRSLIYKAMEMLYVYSQIKKNQAQIINAFRQKERVRVLNICLASLIDNASEMKLKALSFVELMSPILKRSKAVAFSQWMRTHAYLLKVEMADQLYLQRNGKDKKLLVMQILRQETEKRLTKKQKYAKISRHYQHFQLRRVFSKLLQIRNKKLREKLNTGRIRVQMSRRVKRIVFEDLKSYCKVKSRARDARQQVESRQRAKILRLGVQAIISNKITSSSVSLTRAKVEKRQIIAYLGKWRQIFKFARKISRMASIIQSNFDRSFLHKVLPALRRHGDLLTLTASLKQRRNDRLLRSVFSGLINQLSLKKILLALVIQMRQARIQIIFRELRRQTRASIVHRELISTQIDLQNQEDQNNTVRAVFTKLIQFRFKRRAAVCARHKFVYSTLKRVFEGMRQATLKQKTLKFNLTLFDKERLGRYFTLWSAAKELHHREHSAQQVLGFSIKNKVFTALKKHKEKMLAVHRFRKVWEVKRLLFLGLRGFEQHFSISKFHFYVLNHISNKRCQLVKRDALQLFSQGCKESKLERSLQTYHNHRTSKSVIQTWRAMVQMSNKVRLNLIKLRSNLRQNPSLGRPLLVLKNFLLNKAFQLFKEKTKRQRHLRKQSRLSAYALYLRLVRKAFYGLRLNAADEYQSQKSRQIKRLIIKRRGFDSLKLAVKNQKETRVKASHAAIFRFLSLQRKALKSIVIYFTQRCRLKIQNNFAMTLYYKHLMTKGFIGFQIHLIARKQTHRAPPSNIIHEEVPENEYEAPDRQSFDRSRLNHQFDKVNARNQYVDQSRNANQINEEDVTLAPYSKTFVASPPRKAFKTPPNEISTLSNEFVISSMEMGPISSINYQRLQNLPQTMLQDQKKQSMSSSILVDEVPSCISARTPMSSPPTSNKQL